LVAVTVQAPGATAVSVAPPTAHAPAPLVIA